jgi:hypothetical protein
MTRRKAFVTTSVYALAHQMGMQQAVDEVGRQIHAEDSRIVLPEPKTPPLPCVKTIRRLAAFCEATICVDGGATYIGQARSRAFHLAYTSQLPFWVMIDDDIEVNAACAAAMLEALDDLAPRIILTPYLTRSPTAADAIELAVNIPVVREVRSLKDGGIRLLAMPHGQGGGLGFAGMNRAAMEAVAAACPRELAWVDENVEKRALFYERVEDGLWWGEDTSFFRYRVPPEVRVELLITGGIRHGVGPALELSSL